MTKEMEKIIKTSGSFLVVIDRKTTRQEDRYQECKVAEKLKKPIYIIVEEGADWSRFKNLDYRKVFHTLLVTPELIEMVKRDIKEDLDFLKKVGGK